jgi:hypothetical protein
MTDEYTPSALSEDADYAPPPKLLIDEEDEDEDGIEMLSTSPENKIVQIATDIISGILKKENVESNILFLNSLVSRRRPIIIQSKLVQDKEVFVNYRDPETRLVSSSVWKPSMQKLFILSEDGKGLITRNAVSLKHVFSIVVSNSQKIDGGFQLDFDNGSSMDVKPDEMTSLIMLLFGTKNFTSQISV